MKIVANTSKASLKNPVVNKEIDIGLRISMEEGLKVSKDSGKMQMRADFRKSGKLLRVSDLNRNLNEDLRYKVGLRKKKGIFMS